MKIMNFFKNLFQDIEIKQTIKTIKDLDILDDVWIEESGIIRQAWVFEKTRKHICVVYSDDFTDYKFQIYKPFNISEFKQGNKTLYCNKPE